MSEPVVVVVDPDVIWQEDLGNALSPHRVEQVPSLTGGEELLAGPGPALLVLGPNAASEALPRIREVRAQHPGLVVVLVASQVSVGFLQEAMRSGVFDVIDATADRDTLRQCLHGAVAELEADTEQIEEHVQKLAPARLLVVTSAKSGEGCTSVAVNLGAALARHRSVIIVEGDQRFGDLSLALGFPPTALGNGFDDVASDRASVLRHLYDHAATGMRALLPPRSTAPVDQLAEQHVVELISIVQALADIVIVDAPFRLVEEAEMLTYADEVLLVSDLDTTTLKNSMIAVQVLGRVASKETGSLVLNRVAKGAKPDLADIERFVGVRVAGLVPETPDIADSFLAGVPLAISDPKSPYARAFESIAATVVG